MVSVLSISRGEPTEGVLRGLVSRGRVRRKPASHDVCRVARIYDLGSETAYFEGSYAEEARTEDLYFEGVRIEGPYFEGARIEDLHSEECTCTTWRVLSEARIREESWKVSVLRERVFRGLARRGSVRRRPAFHGAYPRGILEDGERFALYVAYPWG